MDAKQFAWLYLIEHGKAGCSPSFYGGYEFDRNVRDTYNAYDIAAYDKIRLTYLETAKRIGVNWTKTKAPKSETHSVFNGTFADAGESEYLDGMLVLNDGSKQHWIAEALEVTNVFEMMATASAAEAKFKEYFGE